MVRGQYTPAAVRGTPIGPGHWLCPQQELRTWSGSWVKRQIQGMAGGVYAPRCQDGLQRGSEALLQSLPFGGGLMEGKSRFHPGEHIPEPRQSST